MVGTPLIKWAFFRLATGWPHLTRDAPRSVHLFRYPACVNIHFDKIDFAATVSSSCCSDFAPMTHEAIAGFVRSQARAICPIGLPRVCENFCKLSIVLTLAGSSQSMSQPLNHSGSVDPRLPAGAGFPTLYFPVRTPPANGLYGTIPMP